MKKNLLFLIIWFSTSTSIAFQCPYSGGEAVYRARAIYQYINGDTDFPEDCSPIAPRMQANTTLVEPIAMLYPNPAADYVMLNMPEIDYNKTFSVNFINAQGAVVLSQQANAVERINTNILPNGLYTCIVKDAANGATLKAQKLIIIRN